ncbi:helix-turn-helix domain-containing protein [Pseudomonas sp. NPDC047961]
MSDLRITTSEPGSGEQRMKPNTYWFHIFQSMIDQELAILGPDAFTVYCVIKSHCNIQTGVSIAAIETIARKAGISPRHVMRQIKKLESKGYISKSRARKYNEYRLIEKVVISDGNGCRHGHAQWDYRPLQIESTVKELKRRLLDMETSTRSIRPGEEQTVQRQTKIGVQITQAELDNLALNNPHLHRTLIHLRDEMRKRRDG